MFSGEVSTSLQLESKTTRKSGKLKSSVSSATNSAAENVKECRKFRLFVRDRRLNLHFLVDSGADVSIISATFQNIKTAEYQLYAANGTEISTYGIKMLNLDLGLRRDFQFPFIIADVTKDRLKPAYILAEDNPKATTTDHNKLQISDNKPDLTQKQSHTGRTIRLPVRFKD
ncbi:hypothetical protein AVEN_86762-1 [Araneus ventricosus]|uniref:Peptidase A2 domain-containing protein n=1 Tax=Araneus ventricosus TaxID=182803 RepID=A0A4Y2UUN3_ARAVE|nr:hypothetical protein AVEN_86762-1 [Araneus ventricosus]